MKRIIAIILLVVFVFCSCAFAEGSSEYSELSKGSKGEDVKALQERLKELGYYSSSIDGDYGNGTAKAVSSFQSRNGIEQSGNADKATLELLYSSEAKTAPAEPPVSISKVSINKSSEWVIAVMHNGTDEIIDSYALSVITYGVDGEVTTNEKLTDEKALLTHSWGRSDKVGKGRNLTTYTGCKYAAWVNTVACGVKSYHTTSGKNVEYRDEAITFRKSDGSIIYPIEEIEPLVYYDSDSENEKYGTSYDDEVFDFKWGYTDSISISPWLAEYEKKPTGIYVTEINYDSPLDKAGITKGDVLVSINGKAWADDLAQLEAKNQYINGEEVVIEYFRNGKNMSVTLSNNNQVSSLAPDNPNLIADEIIKLADLLDRGLLTQEEFDAQKAKLLGN